MNPRAFHILMLAGGMGLALLSAGTAFAHGETHAPDASMFKCRTAGTVASGSRTVLNAPYTEAA